MKKVEKQISMEINGGHYVTAWPHTAPEASQKGTAGWQQYCPNKKHTKVHIFERETYYYRWGTGRMYFCPASGCN
ncbi:MAG: hypothetical protein HFH43_02250 [Lachnospiraceae bacterium]|nr:hypothetical protein C810_02313 [Lachnospiraceae bacterium A2]MCI8881862.1 hypothetical protein [Lachnospiraceae bacterium]